MRPRLYSAAAPHIRIRRVRLYADAKPREGEAMSLPLEMTAIEIAAPGGPEQLKPARRPVPRPGKGEVLVRVAAAGVNRPDVMQRQGR